LNMGSWNQTCMISGLPIVEGDPVKVIFLGETLGDDYSRVRPSTPFEQFQGILLPIDGTYDDAGLARLADGLAWKLHLTIFPVGLSYRLRQGINTIEIAKDGYPASMMFSKTMVHRRFYDLVCGFAPSDRPPVDREAFSRFEDSALGKELWVEAAYHSAYASKCCEFTIGYESIINAMATNPSYEPELIEWISFVYGLWGIRRQLQPMSGWGSQCENWEQHREIAEMVGELCADRLSVEED
jgi:hypothetical protein